jgi:hypothetical protein
MYKYVPKDSIISEENLKSSQKKHLSGNKGRKRTDSKVSE